MTEPRKEHPSNKFLLPAATFLAAVAGLLVAEVLARSTWMDDFILRILERQLDRISAQEERVSALEARIDALELRLERTTRRYERKD